MLSQLFIENIAVIKEAHIDLTEGLNIFTGETGAGKTVLLSAIGAVLGERSSRDIIRTDEEAAFVSAVFTDLPQAVLDTLGEMGYPMEAGEELLISREIHRDGKTSCRIGGRPATATVLRSIAAELVNIHGQQDNWQLLSPEKQLSFIDDFGALHGLVEQYQSVYREMSQIKLQIDSLSLDESQKAQKIDMLEYQINEISQANLIDGEEEELSSMRNVMRNREKIVASLASALSLFDGVEEGMGVSEGVDLLAGELSMAGQYMEDLAQAGARVQEMSYELADFRSTVARLLETMEYDPGQAEYVEMRLDTIFRMKKKYGTTIAEILEYLETAQAELDAITFSGERIQKLLENYDRLYQQAYDLAHSLSDRRKVQGKLFIEKVEGELAFLDMPSVKLYWKFDEKEMGPRGIDEAQLLITTNPGELPKPLSKIASGGEISRIMLSIKNAMTEEGVAQTMIFDEIDSGVSGRAAQKIGQKLSQVAQNRQVICVTHLAQVAAYGDHHLLISKSVEGERTYTQVKPLTPEEREHEIARIISGDNITEISLENAREMLSVK